MISIAFTSLFLGLVLGTNHVGALVDGPVAAVDFELDGRSIGRAVRKPWSVPVDFGSDLFPHELVARARDAAGHETASVRQWLNLPRPDAEMSMVLEKDSDGRPVGARLAWQSILGSTPLSMTVMFDGRRLEIGENRRVSLPPYDARKTHLVSAEVEFESGLRARSDVVLGGASGEEARSELTAIPVTVRTGRDLDAARDLEGCFEKRGRGLRVAAVEEEGPAQILIVRDRGSRETSRALGGSRWFVRQDAERMFGDIRLGRKDRIRFVWPVARRYEDPSIASDLFESTPDLTSLDGGFYWLLTHVSHTQGSLPQQRFADATAVAGLQAFASSRRRAVLLVLGSIEDSSRLAPDTVRRYLEALRVPLFVWSIADPPARPDVARWGKFEDVGSIARFRKAARALRENLAAQRIVWIEGKHLPQEIRLTGKGAAFLELAGSESRPPGEAF